MRKLFTLFIFLLANKMFACVCAPTSLMDLTVKADFIGKVKVLEISKDSENKNFHNLQIEILELFKGSKISSLKLLSRSNSSCSFYTPKNTEWLVFAYKGKDGQLTFGYCSGSKQFDKYDSKIYERYPPANIKKAKTNDKKSLKLWLELLSYIKNNEVKPNNEFDLKIYFTDDCIKQIRGIEEKKERFSLYELTINKDLSIEKVLALKEFDNEKIKLKLNKCVENGITVYRSANEKSIPEKTKIVVGLFYYPAKGKRESFISKHAL